MLTGLIERLLKTPDEWSWPRLASKLIVIWPILVILLGFYWLVPRFTFKDLGSLDAVDRDQIQRFIEDVHTSVTAPSKTPDSKNVATKPFFVPSCQDCTDYRETTLALTPLVQLLVKVPVTVFVNSRDATGLSYSYDLRDPEYYPTVRVDNLVLMFLILVGVTLGLRAVRLSPVVGLVADFSARSRGTAKPITAEAVLEADVVKAEERARDVYKRSTILLGGGIVMAFVGVALFYVTLPSPSAGPSDEQITTLRERADYYSFLLRRYEAFNENRGRSGVPDDLRQLPLPDPHATGDEHPWLTFASHSLRPTGMLIFMEGIAWFLLRQYRVLIEEYKSFLRVYLKRSSYLIAWKAASSAADKQFAVAQAMVSDDLSGTLNKNETTEVLETMRLSEPTPIVEILREVKALMPVLPKK